MEVTLGLGQLLVEGGEPDRNLDRADRMVGEAAGYGCDILLLPECLDLGWTHPSALNEATSVPGPVTDRFCAMARHHGLHICAGMTEKAGDAVFNTALLIDDQGEILLAYRKINVLDIAFPFYAIGSSLSAVETKFGKIGVNICSDNYNDSLDLGHSLARMGARIILSPSSWTVDYALNDATNPYAEKWVRPLSTLARGHNLIIASCTSVGYIVGGPYEGKKMVGCSLVVGPDGVLAQGTYNEVAGELVVTRFTVPEAEARGTQIGPMLAQKGILPNG